MPRRTILQTLVAGLLTSAAVMAFAIRPHGSLEARAQPPNRSAAQPSRATSTPEGETSTRQADRSHRDHEHAAKTPTAGTTLAAPSSIQDEHKHLHEQLEAALAAGGKTAVRAKAVADVLLPHFEQEDAFAMPPLGLLEPLAARQAVDDAQARNAIAMADRLREEYEIMLKEHQVLKEALHALAAAAREEHKPEHVHFAESLIMHARNEEQILYPATLVVGEYLKLLQAGR